MFALCFGGAMSDETAAGREGDQVIGVIEDTRVESAPCQNLIRVQPEAAQRGGYAQAVPMRIMAPQV